MWVDDDNDAAPYKITFAVLYALLNVSAARATLCFRPKTMTEKTCRFFMFGAKFYANVILFFFSG